VERIGQMSLSIRIFIYINKAKITTAEEIMQIETKGLFRLSNLGFKVT